MLASGIQSVLLGSNEDAALQQNCRLFLFETLLGKMVEDSSCPYGNQVLLRGTSYQGCMLLIIAKMLIFSWAESTSSFCF